MSNNLVEIRIENKNRLRRKNNFLKTDIIITFKDKIHYGTKRIS